MIHGAHRHEQLSPDDLPLHIEHDHGVTPATILRSGRFASPANVANYLRTHGIESTGDPTLNALTAWHERLHAYSASRTTAQRRAEQRHER